MVLPYRGLDRSGFPVSLTPACCRLLRVLWGLDLRLAQLASLCSRVGYLIHCRNRGSSDADEPSSQTAKKARGIKSKAKADPRERHPCAVAWTEEGARLPPVISADYTTVCRVQSLLERLRAKVSGVTAHGTHEKCIQTSRHLAVQKVTQDKDSSTSE